MPSFNAYDILDKHVASETKISSVDRNMALVSLKILIAAFKISPKLSLNPELAKEIH